MHGAGCGDTTLHWLHATGCTLGLLLNSTNLLLGGADRCWAVLRSDGKLLGCQAPRVTGQRAGTALWYAAGLYVLHTTYCTYCTYRGMLTWLQYLALRCAGVGTRGEARRRAGLREPLPSPARRVALFALLAVTDQDPMPQWSSLLLSSPELNRTGQDSTTQIFLTRGRGLDR